MTLIATASTPPIRSIIGCKIDISKSRTCIIASIAGCNACPSVSTRRLIASRKASQWLYKSKRIAATAAIIKIIGCASNAVRAEPSCGNTLITLPIVDTSLPIPIVKGARAATTSKAFSANSCCPSVKLLNHSASFCNFGTRFCCMLSASVLIIGTSDAPICVATFFNDSLSKNSVSSSPARAATCSFVRGAIVANSDLN